MRHIRGMPSLVDLLNAAKFDGLAITKTPAGYSVSTYSDGGGWSDDVTRATAGDALLALFEPVPVWLPPCPVALPPCPVPLPALPAA
jgi:hypothetical protein